LGPAPAGQGRAAPPLSFDRYHGYEETANLLRAWASAHPTLARVYSIGKDFKGYDTWLIEITNQRLGQADGKPAFWADGNIDADEPSSTEVILHLAERLLSRYGTDPEITRLVDTTTFYLVPISNPYMADLYVSTPMTGIVSSINARPRDDDGDGRLDEDPPDDVDGDGQILQMRVRDPRGTFRVHARDPRLLMRVRADETGEWTVHTEGLDNDGDGQFNEDWIGGVDLNRNFPFDWQPEWIQEGSGQYPLSEPESRNIVEFIVGHPNIGFVVNGHSGPDDGLLYRPYGSRPDTAIPRQDFLTMATFGEKFASLSGGLRPPADCVAVINSPEGNRDGVAEHTVLLVLALLRHLPRADRQVRNGLWSREENRGTDLHGLTVGIIGLGHMGLAFAERLRGFGVRVLGHDKYRCGHAPPHVEECDLATVQRESDIVSLHLPLTAETRHYADARFLAGFAKPVCLVNTSRGPVLHTAALLDALDSGRVLAAGLDVLEFERPDLSGLDPGAEAHVLERLLRDDRVILTPHIAGVTREGRLKMAVVLAEKILTRFPHAAP
ncbi:MAG: hypothetical protein HUU33_09015, partial [Flavobacteriales bacterium]|nr:hypothetical protein [Flavobacteriales bacterium]